MAVGQFSTDRKNNLIAVVATALTGTLRQLPDGRASVMVGLTAASSGDSRSFTDTGKYAFTKAAGYCLLAGGRAYFNYANGTVGFRKVGDRDFYMGRSVGDAANADVTCIVDLNCKSEFDYDLDLARDPFTTAPVGTQVLGGFLPPQRNGGALHLLLSATNEAQKVDALGVDTFSKWARAIVEFQFRVISDGGSGAQDFSLGVGSGTHATDADSITNHLLMHLDGNATAIKLQSKDGTTTVTATDTTKTYTEGALLAQRKEVWIDMRTPADVQVYIDGVNVLPATVFDLSAAANELHLLAHLEKTATTDVYEVAIDKMCARFQE